MRVAVETMMEEGHELTAQKASGNLGVRLNL